MLSPAPSQELLISGSASNGTPVYVHPSHGLTRENLEQSRLDFTITAKKYNTAKSKTKAKIDISCVNCDFEDMRDWQGCIVGKGIHGSVYAFFARIKHKHKLLRGNKRLIGLLTICDDCCIDLGWYSAPDRNHVLGFGGVNKISASLVLSVTYKEIEEVVSSGAIILGDPLVNAIKTVGIDGREKEWHLLNKLLGRMRRHSRSTKDIHKPALPVIYSLLSL